MTTKDIAYHRLVGQSIADPYLASPADVVRSLGAVQAQDYGQALWAIGLRTKGSTLATVLEAIESGKILRTWTMRGTIHFVPAEDAKWMVSLIAERTIRSAAMRHANLELDDTTFRRAEALFREALGGGTRLARPVLMKLLDDNGITTKDQRGYHILWTLALRGVLCVGPMEEKRQTFALLDEWAPNARELSREEGLGELARRYFMSHGPATLADFAMWSGQTLTNAKIGLEIAKPSLTVELVGGLDYWMDRDQRRVDTQALSTWKRTVNRAHVSLRLSLFEELNPEAEREIYSRALAYGEFMGQSIALAKL